ncbi:MAG: serine/threonine-protein kinase [Acidobacteriota bacterium]
MDGERWRRVETLYYGALELDDGGRRSYLRKACGDDLDLLREVESLLDVGADADRGEARLADLLSEARRDQGVQDAGDNVGGEESTAGPDPPRTPGDDHRRLGPYRLLREIGRGGLGTVYLAERDDEHYSMRVAIKLVRRGLDTDDVLDRLRRERQILAQLEHPNITRLIDGGSTRSGQPYLVMEYVEGRSLLEHADAQRLDLRRRLRLMIDMCHAVDAAHRRLIIHRDLKPTNVLVTADGQVKLLDFGIAQLLDRDPELEATQPERRLLTPAYASPEQLAGEALTTATDIYSLGAVLYRLLTGSVPFPGTADGGAPNSRREPPVRPSLSVADAPDAESIASSRGLSPAVLVRRLRGDLDTIGLRALALRPEDRYGSVTALAEDLQRHLDDRPILAKRPGLGLRVLKLVRRHRLTAAVMALASVGLAAALVAVLWQARQADRARVEAERVSDFLTELVEAATPEAARGEVVSVADILDRGAERIEGELAEEPQARARLATTMGRAYGSLGDYRQALRLHRTALAIRERRFGLGSVEWATSAHEVAVSLINLDEADQAHGLLLEAEDIRRRSAVPADDLADTLNSLAQIERRKRRPKAAEAYYLEALELYRRAHGERHEDVAGALYGLGVLKFSQGDFPPAETYLADALQMRTETLGDDHPATLNAASNLARVLRKRGQLSQAATLLTQTLAIQRRLLGDRHRSVGAALIFLSKIRADQGLKAESVELLRTAIPIFEGAVGPASFTVATLTADLGELLTALEDPETERTLRHAVDLFDSLPESPESARASELLGSVLCRRTEVAAQAEAMTLLQTAIAARTRLHTTAEDLWRVAAAQVRLGQCHLHRGRSDAARAVLEPARAVLVERFGADDPRVEDVDRWLATARR